MRLMLALLFSSLSMSLVHASCRADSLGVATPNSRHSAISNSWATPGQQHPGVAQQIRVFKLAKKAWRHQEGAEKAGKKARIALWLFAGASALLPLGTFFLASWLVNLSLGLWIASMLVSLWILIAEKNPRSRKIAKALLIVSGATLLLSFLLAGLLGNL